MLLLIGSSSPRDPKKGHDVITAPLSTHHMNSNPTSHSPTEILRILGWMKHFLNPGPSNSTINAIQTFIALYGFFIGKVWGISFSGHTCPDRQLARQTNRQAIGWLLSFSTLWIINWTERVAFHSGDKLSREKRNSTALSQAYYQSDLVIIITQACRQTGGQVVDSRYRIHKSQ